jgi:hypothetical protein
MDPYELKRVFHGRIVLHENVLTLYRTLAKRRGEKAHPLLLMA